MECSKQWKKDDMIVYVYVWREREGEEAKAERRTAQAEKGQVQNGVGHQPYHTVYNITRASAADKRAIKRGACSRRLLVYLDKLSESLLKEP